MKPLVIYHDHCTDGFGAAFAAWKKFGDEAEYRACSYGSDQHNTVDGFISYYGDISERDVYILDFSFPREVTEYSLSRAKRLIWLDHHKTAFEMWCGKYEKGMLYMAVEEDQPRNQIILDDNKSGAMIAWEYFHPNTEVPMLIKHIDDRDRWQFKLRGSKKIHAALASYKPWSFSQWDELTDDEHYGAMFSEGSAILRAHEQNVKSAVGAGKREVNICRWFPDEHGAMTLRQDYPGLSTNCTPHLASDVGHELANESSTFGLCWYMGNNGKAKCSLRSNGTYDVSAIAKAFGGGGHMNAAGFEVDMSTLMGWMK